MRASRTSHPRRVLRAPAKRPTTVVAPAQPVNLAMLLTLVGLDAEHVSPATGRAIGV